MSNDIQANVNITSDPQDARRVQRAVDDIGQAFDRFEQDVEQTDKAVRDLFAGGSSGVKNRLKGELDATKQSAIEAEAAIRDLASASDRARNAGGGGKQGGRLSNIDVGGVGGRISAAGQATGISALGDVGGMVEGIGQLTEGLGGMAGKVGMLSTALPIAGVALAAVTAGVALYNKSMEDQVKALNSTLDAQRAVTDMLNAGATETDAQDRLQELERIMENEQRLLDERTAAYDEYVRDGNVATETFKRVFDPKEAGLNTAVEAQKDLLRDLSAEHEELTRALEDQRFATADAADGVMANATAASEMAMLELEAANATREANRARLEGIQVQRAGLAAELAALQASGSANDEVAARVEELTNQIKQMDAQTGVLQTAIASAGEAADETTEALERSTDARRQEASAADEASKKTKKSGGAFSATLANLFGSTAKKQRETVEQQATAAVKSYDDQLQQQQDFYQRLQDQITDFNRSREDLLLEGDFRALDALERDFQTSIGRSARDAGQSITQIVNQLGGNTTNNSVPIQTAMNQEQIIRIIEGLLR